MSNSLSNISVGGSDVKKAMTSSQAASAMLQAYTNTVLETPDIRLPQSVDTDSNSTVVEDLPTHQALARANATTYLNIINPKIVGTLADVIGFANLFKSELDTFIGLARNINDGDNKQTFESGLQSLIKDVTQRSNNTMPVIDALNGLLPKTGTDLRHFEDDLKNVTTALTGQDGEIQELMAKIAAFNKDINKDIEIIALGATGEVVGILAVSVGVITLPEGFGAAFLVAGLLVLAGSTTAIAVAGTDLKKAKDGLRAATRELNADMQNLALTMQSMTTVDMLMKAVASGIAAVETVQKGWNALASDFGEVLRALGKVDPDNAPVFLVDMLNAAGLDWADTLTLALHLQSTGTLPVKMDDPQMDDLRIAA